MAKTDKVNQARRAFVQARAQKTGKTAAEDRAKFRQRFEKLAATPEGRAKIQQLTGIQGVRKELKSAYGQKSTTTTTTTTKTTTAGVGVSGPARKTEAQTEAALRSQRKPYNVVRQTSAAKPAASSATQDTGLNTIQKLLIGGGAAAAAYGVSNRAYRLAQIDAQNAKFAKLGMSPSEAQAQLQGLGGRTTRSLAGAAREGGVRLFNRFGFGGGGSRLLGR